MPSKELIEKVASHFEFPDRETTLITAENILNEIHAALQEPTEGMLEASESLPEAYGHDFVWRAMLNASALCQCSDLPQIEEKSE